MTEIPFSGKSLRLHRHHGAFFLLWNRIQNIPPSPIYQLCSATVRSDLKQSKKSYFACLSQQRGKAAEQDSHRTLGQLQPWVWAPPLGQGWTKMGKGFGCGQAGQGYGEVENDSTAVLLRQGLTAFWDEMGFWAQCQVEGALREVLSRSPLPAVCLHTLQNSEVDCCGPFDCCELGFFRPHRGREWMALNG